MTLYRPVAADPRWPLIAARDKAADGLFWFSVTTTGIYCRPGCPARTPHPEHVLIHDTLEAARATGARACRRCRPDDGNGGEALRRAMAAIRVAEEVPSLAELAKAAGLSVGRFRRAFTAATGLTPSAYAKACRAERLREALADGEPVTAALHGAGYGSSAAFYAEAADRLGMAPAAARDGGAGERLRYALRAGPMGPVLVARSDRGVAAILMGDDAPALVADLRRRFPRAALEEAEADLGPELEAVLALVREPARAIDLPLDVRGTAFQQRVWDALRRIPAGRTASYAEIAAAIGAPGSARAVAGACAANSLAVIIPCHRVVRGDGDLSGYRWGVERKRALLARERGESDA